MKVKWHPFAKEEVKQETESSCTISPLATQVHTYVTINQEIRDIMIMMMVQTGNVQATFYRNKRADSGSNGGYDSDPFCAKDMQGHKSSNHADDILRIK